MLEGPNPRFREPGGFGWDNGFSMNAEFGPFLFSTPEVYARGKAKQFPDEGGPALLAVEVPEEIVREAANAWFPINQGLVQFDQGSGLEELLESWPNLWKELRDVP